MLLVLFWFWLGMGLESIELANESRLQPVDSALLWLSRLETADGLLTKAEIEHSLGREADALQTLASVSELYPLSPMTLLDISRVPEVWALSDELDNLQSLQALINIADDEGTYASALARNALSGVDVFYPPLLVEDEISVERSSNTSSVQFSNRLSVRPNPAYDWVTIEFSEVSKSKLYFVQTVNARGQIVQEDYVSEDSQSISFSIASLPSGVYKAVIHQADAVAYTCTFTIIRN